MPYLNRILVSLLFLLTGDMASAFVEQASFYIGTYTDSSSSKGIYQGTIDIVNGKLGPLKLAAQATDPSFLALRPDNTALYAAEETPGIGQVQSFARKPDGSLTPLNEQSAEGNGTCHASVDPSGRDVFIANFGTGNIACFPLKPNGSISPRSAMIQFPVSDSKHPPHAHSNYVSPDGKFVYSCDLGSDHVWIFKFDAAAGTLTPNDPPSASVPPGHGARHLAFSKDGKFIYVVNEMGHSVTLFARNAATGGLIPIQTVDALPPTTSGNQASAEIVLHPSGRWLYVSNRGSDTISVFEIDSVGKLALIQNFPAEVQRTRSFAIDPMGHWMITAGQQDNRIAVLEINVSTGKLSATGHSAPVGSPVCVLFEER